MEQEIRMYFERTSSKSEVQKSAGFKYYARGREEWRIEL